MYAKRMNQVSYIQKLPAGNHNHESFAKHQQRIKTDLAKACEIVNRLLHRFHGILIQELGSSEVFEKKTRSTFVHDAFVAAMKSLGYMLGPKNGKPDLIFISDTGHIWIEIKASTCQDWQAHPTVGQLPPPVGHLHILLGVGEVLERVYVLEDAQWADGSSKNGKYIRLDKSSHARKELIWSAEI